MNSNRVQLAFFAILILIVALAGCSALHTETLSVNRDGIKIAPSTRGIYHGAFPDLVEGATSGTPAKIQALEKLTKKPLAWVLYQHDFSDGLVFPTTAAKEILSKGKVPYIRMAPWSVRNLWYEPDPVYSMQSFIDGKWDKQIREWARQAKRIGSALMVEFGPEVNGQWFPWNGMWNGGANTKGYGDPSIPDGPERFRDAYRHVIDLFRAEAVQNVTWVFHIDSQASPEEPWNAMAYYYPGDDYIDWIGISVFGAQMPNDWWGSFTQILDDAWTEITRLSNKRPMAIVEWGVTEKPNTPDGKARWIDDALRSVLAGRYPKIKGMSYWQETPSEFSDLNLGINSSPQALESYRNNIADPRFLPKAEIIGP